MSTNFDYDSASVEHISYKRLLNEPELFNSKWWDYRWLHPMQATELFAQAYQEAIKKGVSQRRDLDAGKNAVVLKAPSFLDESNTLISGMWNARRMADQLGIKYESYCRYAINYALLCDWKYLPRPNQMYSEKMPENGSHSMISYIAEAWSKSANHFPVHRNYLPAHYVGNEYQRTFLNYILSRIERSKFKAGAVAKFVLDKELISSQLLVAKFGDDAVNWLIQAEEFNQEAQS